jgi:AraC-like DNA-binding protein
VAIFLAFSQSVFFNSADVALGQREEVVRDVVCKGVVPVEIEHLRPEPCAIDFQLSSAALGPITVQSLRSSATAFKRTPRLVREDSPPNVVVAVKRAGSSILTQEGREAALGANEVVLVSSTQPCVIRSGASSPVLLVLIPKERLAVPEEALRRAVALCLGPELPIAGVLGRLVNDLATLPDLEPFDAAQLARPTIELVRALIATVAGDARRARESLDATLQMRINDYLRMHCYEHDLTADRIAAAHYISTRHLYRLLAAEGISLGTWLREQRLEACRDELARPTAAANTVASVGRRWGFSDETNFGRAFKAAFGVTPREWRCLHQQTRAVQP